MVDKEEQSEQRTGDSPNNGGRALGTELTGKISIVRNDDDDNNPYGFPVIPLEGSGLGDLARNVNRNRAETAREAEKAGEERVVGILPKNASDDSSVEGTGEAIGNDRPKSKDATETPSDSDEESTESAK